MSRENSLRNFSYVGFGRLISNGLQAVFFIIFAYLLDPMKYGELSYLISIAGTASIISRFGFPYLALIYQAKDDKNSSNSVNVLAVISTGIAAIILISVDVYVALLCFALSLFIMNQHNLIGMKRYKHYLIVSILRGVLFISLPLMFYFIFEIPGILIGIIISYFIGSFEFLRIISKLRNFPKFKPSFKLLTNNFSVDASNNLPRWIDKLVIVPLFGLSIVGIYQFNLQIMFLFAILPTALHSFLLSEEASGIKHKKIIFIVLVLAMIIVLTVIIISPLVIEFMFPNYVEGINSLQIMIISIIPLTFASIFNAKLQAKESTLIGYSALVRIAALLGLTAILGSFYGLIGLAYSVLISTILYLISLYIIYKKTHFTEEN